MTIELAATSTNGQLVLIGKRPLPNGVTFASAYGKPSLATVTGHRQPRSLGEHVLTFTARTHDLPESYARPRSFLVYVTLDAGGPEKPSALNWPRGMSRWAHVRRSRRTRPSRGQDHHQAQSADARADPEPRADTSTVRSTRRASTGCGSASRSCPTGRRAGSRAALSAPITRSGRTSSSTAGSSRRRFIAAGSRSSRRESAGKPYWPTPAGRLRAREDHRLSTDLRPDRLGTNARSAVLTDWPGGGFIGIHGTNQPEILPGRVSHGCVRMPNPAVLRLARLMPLGTPVTIL